MGQRKAKYADNPWKPSEHERHYGKHVTRLQKRQSNAGYHGGDLEPHEVEFIMAMDEYKRKNRRPFPTWSEVLMVLVGLGWRKES